MVWWRALANKSNFLFSRQEVCCVVGMGDYTGWAQARSFWLGDYTLSGKPSHLLVRQEVELVEQQLQNLLISRFTLFVTTLFLGGPMRIPPTQLSGDRNGFSYS
jgi:hypothetical protein